MWHIVLQKCFLYFCAHRKMSVSSFTLIIRDKRSRSYQVAIFYKSFCAQQQGKLEKKASGLLQSQGSIQQGTSGKARVGSGVIVVYSAKSGCQNHSFQPLNTTIQGCPQNTPPHVALPDFQTRHHFSKPGILFQDTLNSCAKCQNQSCIRL